jgi:hypothetical protein
MRTTLALAGLAGLIGSADLAARTRAQAASPVQQTVPFRVGEKMTYQAKVNFLNAGSATMSVEGIETIRGRPAYHTVFDVRSTLFFVSSMFWM